jgi:hypothetical protein
MPGGRSARAFPVNNFMGEVMIAVIFINAVLSALVVVGIVGSLAYSIGGRTPLRVRNRVLGDPASRLWSVPAAQQPMSRL